MATTNELNKQLQKRPEQKDLRTLIQESAKELGKALPKHMGAERLVRIALTCIRTTPDLARCTPESLLGSLFTSAQIGIEPIGGRAYLLPFNNNRKRPDGSGWHSVKECQFIIGYKGLVELFYRHDKAVQLDWGIVREGDEFDYELGTDAYLRHKPAKSGQGEVLSYWVMATLKNGGKPFIVKSKADCLEHGKNHSKTYSKSKGEFFPNSPWVKELDAMCLKTCLVQLAKLLPLSVELQRAIDSDESSRSIRSGVGDILDVPSETNWDEVEKDVKKEDEKEAEATADGEGDNVNL